MIAYFVGFIVVFGAVLIVCILAMVAAGDLRVTAKQQRDWEAKWYGMSHDERERIAKLTWS